MSTWIPEITAGLLFPWLIVQGKRVRRDTPRLPEAIGPRTGLMSADGQALAAEEDPTMSLQLVGIGESPVAGVGVVRQDQAITAQCARLLAQKLDTPVSWQAYGKNGATAGYAVHKLMPAITPRKVDIVVVGFGVNDTTAFTSVKKYRQDIKQLIGEIQNALQPEVIVLASVPDMGLFPALPQPLRTILGMKAKVLDQAIAKLAAGIPNVLHVPVVVDATETSLMAEDGYHPSEIGVIMWAKQIVRALV